VTGIIQGIERKVTKRKSKAVIEDPMVEVLAKQLSILRTTKVKDSEMVAHYVIAQEIKE